MTPSDPYAAWCLANDCTHGHCPDGCEKPQPFAIGAVLYCGRCWHLCGELTPMEPCAPRVCAEDAR